MLNITRQLWVFWACWHGKEILPGLTSKQFSFSDASFLGSTTLPMNKGTWFSMSWIVNMKGLSNARICGFGFGILERVLTLTMEAAAASEPSSLTSITALWITSSTYMSSLDMSLKSANEKTVSKAYQSDQTKCDKNRNLLLPQCENFANFPPFQIFPSNQISIFLLNFLYKN